MLIQDDCIPVVFFNSKATFSLSLTVRFLTKRFIGEYDDTLESTYRQDAEVAGEVVAIELTDTAGENSPAKLERCLEIGEVFVVLYSITSRHSFDEASRIGTYIKERKSSDAMTLTLVGTKKDLEHFRIVQETEGSDLAQELEATFFEISVSESNGFTDVSRILHSSIKRFIKRDKIEKEKEKGNNSMSLLKMKDSIIRRTPSFRRKSIAVL
ncbi:ras-related and estrogen-regulated growth inhibitor isoform X2 [Nematostella vectensis]|uniref:ras-related and estrogen-regulated growth inhibitor isoform X2 n=1 Tax=Nematostella vectensis TaxID=45351 RepID=UPI00138FFAD8|nr:ras-related and estrogen-regulated growth inhibitor isoform X2 [Nematostella vectensis]